MRNRPAQPRGRADAARPRFYRCGVTDRWCDRFARAPAAAGIASANLRPYLPGAAHDILVAGQLLHAYRTSGVETIGGYADLRTHPELPAISELRGSIVQHDGAVHLLQEARSGRGIGRHDGFGVRRAVTRDMGDGFVDAIYHPHRDDRIQVLGVPVLFSGSTHSSVDALRDGIAAHLASGREQILDDRRQVSRD